MKELLMKKKENAILKSQVEQYEKLLNEVSKQMQENQGKNNSQINENIGEGYKVQRFNSKSGAGLNRGSSKKEMNTINSRVSVAESSNKNVAEKYENTINHLNNVINKEKKRVRDLKTLYMK